ncbi:MAG: hypothetical protein ACJAVV_000113 [Alphaproteobacteria bacterium]|jgi:hypothetical protein
MIAVFGLLLLLGILIGLDITYSSFLSALRDSLDLGTTIWILLSTLIAMAAGGLLAAKLTRPLGECVEAPHSLTVLSVSTMLSIFFGGLGIGGAVIATGEADRIVDKTSAFVFTNVRGSEASVTLPDLVVTRIAAIIKGKALSAIAKSAQSVSSTNQLEAGPEIDSTGIKYWNVPSKVKSILNKVTEVLATYIKAALRSAFVAATVGMILSLAVESLRARSARRIYAARE